jgi:twitching motility protein PilT
VAEVLAVTQAVRAVIREKKIHQIYSLMQAGQKHGMQTMNQSLCNAALQGKISTEVAMEQSPDSKELEQMLARGGPGAAAGRRAA